MSSGIYKFENKINHLCYIGQAKNLEERKYRHYRNFMNNRCDTDFYKAVYEFGVDNFDYKILECGNFSQEELNELEIKYISKMEFILHIFQYIKRNRKNGFWMKPVSTILCESGSTETIGKSWEMVFYIKIFFI